MSTRHGLNKEGGVICDATAREDGSNVTSDPYEVTCPDCWPIVPAHINSVTGMFCSGGGLATQNGRCQEGCDHAKHYSNDGHPECEDIPVIPGPGGQQ